MSTVSGDRAVWSAKQGDTWVRSWTCATPTQTWDLSNLLVQIWHTSSGLLVASTESIGSPPSGYWGQISTTGSEGSPGQVVLALSLAVPASATVSGGYVIEGQCNVNSVLKTFLERGFEVRKQWAVAS